MVVIGADEAFRRALALYRAGQLAAAERLCRAALRAEPGHAPSACLVALLAARAGRSAEADPLLAGALERPAYSITLDYPVPARPRHGASPHARLAAVLERGAGAYRERLAAFARLGAQLAAIPEVATEEDAPFWSNPWIPPFDGVALYALTALLRPRRYVEVGSGVSTKFVRRAIRDHALATAVVSIDPEPRAEIDALCDVIVRAPLEAADLAPFAALGAGDLVFVDGSHRCFMGSDATVFFTEVLPALAPGVTVGVHDIFLPFDYPSEWVQRYYSEQYLLACYLLAPASPFRVLLPMHFALSHPACAPPLAALARALPAGAPRAGTSFWLETGGA